MTPEMKFRQLECEARLLEYEIRLSQREIELLHLKFNKYLDAFLEPDVPFLPESSEAIRNWIGVLLLKTNNDPVWATKRLLNRS